MKITGWIRNSLIDYPGKVSLVLFASGCNLRCEYCHNPDVARGMSPIVATEKEIINYIKKQDKWIDAIVVSGGEALLQVYPYFGDKNGLIHFLRDVRKEFPNKKIKLDTNGTLPEHLDKVISEDLVDYIAMDIKPKLVLSNNKDYYMSILIVKQFAEEGLGGVMKYDTKWAEWRWTCYPKDMKDENVVQILAPFADKNIPLYLQQFHRDGKLMTYRAKRTDPCSLSYLNSIKSGFEDHFQKIEVRT